MDININMDDAITTDSDEIAKLVYLMNNKHPGLKLESLEIEDSSNPKKSTKIYSSRDKKTKLTSAYEINDIEVYDEAFDKYRD